MKIRKYRPTDREPIKAITAICFADVSTDHAIEARYGQVAGKDWRYRKVRHIDDDIAANADGIFIAEEGVEGDAQIIGYITTRIDHDTKIGGIPNLGVLPTYRRRGLEAN
ncbi:MAG: GNAT family N-acetyltransferase [Caldilineaceae bacterium]